MVLTAPSRTRRGSAGLRVQRALAVCERPRGKTGGRREDVDNVILDDFRRCARDIPGAQRGRRGTTPGHAEGRGRMEAPREGSAGPLEEKRGLGTEGLSSRKFGGATKLYLMIDSDGP